MIRIDAIKQAVSASGEDRHFLPGQTHTLVIPSVLPGHDEVKYATDQEVYALRSAILVGEVFPEMYNQLKVDFTRVGFEDPDEPGGILRSEPALDITYVPKGISDAEQRVRSLPGVALPAEAIELINTTHRPRELMRALRDNGWPVQTIAEEFDRSPALIRRYIKRNDLDPTRIAEFRAALPEAPTKERMTRHGVYARDRDTEFEFRTRVGKARLDQLKQRVEEYESLRAEGGRRTPEERDQIMQLWLDVDAVLKETNVSKTRLAVELGYTTSGVRNAIAKAHARANGVPRGKRALASAS